MKMLPNFRPLHTRWLQSTSLPLMNGNHSELNNTNQHPEWQRHGKFNGTNAYSVRFLVDSQHLPFSSFISFISIHQLEINFKLFTHQFQHYLLTLTQSHYINGIAIFGVRVKSSIEIYEICGWLLKKCERTTLWNKWKIKCTDWKKERQISNNNLKLQCERFAIVPFHLDLLRMPKVVRMHKEKH